jgi:hypothetical protein
MAHATAIAAGQAFKRLLAGSRLPMQQQPGQETGIGLRLGLQIGEVFPASAKNSPGFRNSFGAQLVLGLLEQDVEQFFFGFAQRFHRWARLAKVVFYETAFLEFQAAAAGAGRIPVDFAHRATPWAFPEGGNPPGKVNRGESRFYRMIDPVFDWASRPGAPVCTAGLCESG